MPRKRDEKSRHITAAHADSTPKKILIGAWGSARPETPSKTVFSSIERSTEPSTPRAIVTAQKR